MNENNPSEQRTEPCGCDCDHVHRSLCELFDGDISPVRAEEIRREVAMCPDCWDRLHSEENMRALMRRCGANNEAPVTLRQRISAQIQVIRYSN